MQKEKSPLLRTFLKNFSQKQTKTWLILSILNKKQFFISLDPLALVIHNILHGRPEFSSWGDGSFMRKILLSTCLCLVVIGNSWLFTMAQAEGDKPLAQTPAVADDPSVDQNETEGPPSYFDYYQRYSGENQPVGFQKVAATAMSAAQASDMAVETVSDRKAAVIGNGNEWCEWSIEVAQEGNYEIWLDYLTLPGKEKEILLSISVDGALPYAEADKLVLSRVWKYSTTGGTYERDSQGNDIQPGQVENPRWQSRSLLDVQGLYAQPYFFHLTEGTHTIRLTAKRGAAAIGEIRIGNPQEPVSYDEYAAAHADQKVQGETLFIRQAEQAFEKSSPQLYPTYDRGNAATQPNDPAQLRLNTIGQSNWGTPGDSISWEVNVPQAGLYRIALRARQNYNQGMKSYRTLRINGEIPFAEAESIAFPYSQSWYVQVLGDETPYEIYLEPGDILTLSCTSGEMSEVLRNVRESILRLNEVYRQIIAVTSTDPDIYQDYSLEMQIPGLETQLKELGDFLSHTADLAQAVTGTRGSQAAELDYVAVMMYEFAENPVIIPERLSRMKDEINAVASMLNTLGQIPLELDYIAFLQTDAPVPAADASLWNRFVFAWKQFTASFLQDYSSLGGSGEEAGPAIKVWVSTGRDQARIIKNMISGQFTYQTGIPVELNMVDTGSTLIKAALAGKGPDVALQTGNAMELAYRGALVDLSQYDLSEIQHQFFEETWVPYRYNGGLYALPETQTFDVLFYRTDVFQDLGLTVPDTWDDFYQVLARLQKNNLEVGIPEINALNMGVSDGVFTFDKLLLQKGESYYNSRLTATTFSSEAAYQAFEEWVNLYKVYGLSRQYDFYSRFRSGEMPLAIQNYSAYNQLAKAAPELQGLWEMAPIPGTRQADGSIDRSESCTFTGCFMLNSAKEKGVDQEAIQFMTWWVDGDTQAAYGQELESALGIAARYTPANKEALEKLDWTAEEQEVLLGQMAFVKPIEQIPGNYIIGRSLTTAFRAAVTGQTGIRQAFTNSTKTINDEITRKRREFNLD